MMTWPRLSVLSCLLREVETEMDNIRSDQRRAEFYANRVLCALRHITDIVQHMHRSGGFSHTEVQELETLRENLRAIYGLIVQLPVMHGYSYRPQVESSSGPRRPRYVIPSEQLSCLRSEFNSWTQIAADLGVSRQTIYNRRRELGFLSSLRGTVIFLALTWTILSEMN